MKCESEWDEMLGLEVAPESTSDMEVKNRLAELEASHRQLEASQIKSRKLMREMADMKQKMDREKQKGTKGKEKRKYKKAIKVAIAGKSSKS